MVDFYKTENCKICQLKGIPVFSKKYDDETLRNFFDNYYGNTKYNNFKNVLEGVNYELLKCEKCFFIWQKYSPKEKFSFDLYENIIDKKESLKKSSIKFENQKTKNDKEIDKIIDYFKNEKINILDFGAGWGHWLISGNRSKYNAYAFELSPSRKKYLQNNHINILNYDNISKYKNFFHFIRLDQVLEHIDDINSLLKTIKFLGREECIFFISVPDGKNIIKKSNFSISKGPIQPLEHLNCFSRHSLIKILNKNDFKCIDIKKTMVINLKNFKLDLLTFKSILYDLKNYFYSTTIKFVNK